MKPDLSAHSSPAAPASSPLPLRRALTDVFALSAVTLGAAAFGYLGGVAILLAPGTDRLVAFSEDLTRGLLLVSVAGGGLWLLLLIRNRPYAAAVRTAAVGAVAVMTVWALADRSFLPGLGGDYRVAEAVLCLWLGHEILQRHGIGLSGARSRSGTWWRACAIAVPTLSPSPSARPWRMPCPRTDRNRNSSRASSALPRGLSHLSRSPAPSGPGWWRPWPSPSSPSCCCAPRAPAPSHPPLHTHPTETPVSTRRPGFDRPAPRGPRTPHVRHRRPHTPMPASRPESPGPRWAAFTTAVRAVRPVEEQEFDR